jgi:hypothetical protein
MHIILLISIFPVMVEKEVSYYDDGSFSLKYLQIYVSFEVQGLHKIWCTYYMYISDISHAQCTMHAQGIRRLIYMHFTCFESKCNSSKYLRCVKPGFQTNDNFIFTVSLRSSRPIQSKCRCRSSPNEDVT